MSKFKFELNTEGVAELMKSPAMVSVLNEYGNQIMSRVGDGYTMDSYVGKNRANVGINASTFQARRDNLDNNTLLKAIR